MGRRHSRRLCRDAGFRVYRRLRSAITLANQRQSHLVSDRIFKNPIAVQSGFSEEELFPLRTASRVHFSPVGIHPRRAWRSQVLIHMHCHPERSEGPLTEFWITQAFSCIANSNCEVPRSARNDGKAAAWRSQILNS